MTAFRQWWVVGMMTLLLVFSFLDRGILALLVEPIKADLGLSDTQMSLLLGLAFAALYAAMGIPFGVIADRGSRVRLVAVGLFVWTLATALSGRARSFGVLFLMRMGVGVGEATLGTVGAFDHHRYGQARAAGHGDEHLHDRRLHRLGHRLARGRLSRGRSPARRRGDLARAGARQALADGLPRAWA